MTKFAKDLIGSIDVLRLALNSVAQETLTAPAVDKDLKSLHEGVSLTKASIEKVLARHGVTPFDPTGEQFDPNRHEALYQAPIPGKEAGSVLECQEIGCEWLPSSGCVAVMGVGRGLANGAGSARRGGVSARDREAHTD